MTDKANPDSKTGAAKKSLTDGDIATYARRTGPSGAAPGTDVDTHSDVDVAAHTDHDTAPAQKPAAAHKASGTDADAVKDRDA